MAKPKESADYNLFCESLGNTEEFSHFQSGSNKIDLSDGTLIEKPGDLASTAYSTNLGSLQTKLRKPPTTKPQTKKSLSSLITGSTVSWCASIIGAGWLSLPKAFALMGMTMGCLMMIFTALCAIINVHIISLVLEKLKNKNITNYGNLAAVVLGKRWRTALNITYGINLVGTLIAFSSILNTALLTLIQSPVENLFGIADTDFNHKIFSLIAFLAVVILTLPLQLLTNTAKFGFVGFVGVATTVYILVVVCVQAPSYRQAYTPKIDFVTTDTNPLLIIENLGLFFFALYCMDCYFMVREDMGKQAKRKNFMKVGISTVTVCFTIFLALGVVAYLSMGDQILSLGIDIYPNRPALAGSTDLAMVIGKVAVLLTILASNITRVIALKKHTFDMMGRDLTKNANIIFTVCFMFLPSIIAFVYPDVLDWVGLCGAFCNSSLGVGFPALMGCKYYWSKGKKPQAFAVAFWGITVQGAFYMATGLTLFKMANIYTPK